MRAQDAIRENDCIKIKSNPYTRQHGIRCHNRLSANDNHLAAREIGTVKRSSYKCHSGEMVGHWTIEFSRGRTVSLSCDFAESDTAHFLLDSDADDFMAVRRS